LLWVENRASTALEEAERGIAVDPLSGVAHLAYSRTLRLLGQADKSFVALNRAIELQPNLWVPYIDLAEYYAARREPERAADAVRKFLRTAYPDYRVNDDDVRAVVGIVGGDRSVNASTVVRRLERGGISLQPGTVARWFALTGQNDSAFARMQRAIDTRSADVATALPFLRPILGNDARWPALERGVGLAP
jgi:tetratricopeptide (TPR) repeat protein